MVDNRHRWARYTRASDYSHSEGTENPIAKFERIMEKCDQATLDKCYHCNLPEVMDGAYNFYGRLAVSRTVLLTVQALL